MITSLVVAKATFRPSTSAQSMPQPLPGPPTSSDVDLPAVGFSSLSCRPRNAPAEASADGAGSAGTQSGPLPRPVSNGPMMSTFDLAAILLLLATVIGVLNERTLALPRPV